MTDLIRLSYQSVFVGHSDESIAGILAQSLQNNLGHDITACLFSWNNRFYQFIEGERSPVQHLFARIKADPRHKMSSLPKLCP